MQPKVFREIIVCDNCKGHGTIGQSELEDYHRGEYRYWNTVCTKCNGSGRMMQVVTTTVEPYDNSEVTMLKLKDTDS